MKDRSAKRDARYITPRALSRIIKIGLNRAPSERTTGGLATSRGEASNKFVGEEGTRFARASASASERGRPFSGGRPSSWLALLALARGAR